MRALKDWERDELIKNLANDLAICDKRIQDAMIDHFTQADEDYGRRVKEEIKKVMKDIQKTKATDNTPGSEAIKTKYGQGSLAANEAAKDAVKKSRESDPY